MNPTATAPAASTSRLPPPALPPLPPPPPPLHPPARNGKRSSKRLSGNSGNTATLLNSGSTRSNGKQKPSLSHVINHLKDSPPAHLTSFLSLDSATTPMTGASTSYSHHHHYQQQHSQVQTPLTAASTNSNYPFPYHNPHARAMSPMTLMELPPLRMEGLTRESVFVDQALSSASSYTVTPIWELSESSGSAALKGLGSNLKSGSDGSASERATPTTPPTSAGTAAPPSPSPSPNTNANADMDTDSPPKPRLDLDFGLGEGDEVIIDDWNSSPSQAQTPFNSPASKANSGSQQPFIYSTLFPTPKHEGDSDSNSATPAGSTTPTPPSSLAFLEEVDRWLAYIEKSLSQLERRHLRLNVA